VFAGVTLYVVGKGYAINKSIVTIIFVEAIRTVLSNMKEEFYNFYKLV